MQYAILLSQDYEDKCYYIESWEIKAGSSEKYKEEIKKYNESSTFKHASIYFAMSEYDLMSQVRDHSLAMSGKKDWKLSPACSLFSLIFGEESDGIIEK